MKRYLAYAICTLALQGCFTGVESAPKISYSDVKREKIKETPEMSFLDDVAPQPPAQWQPGKRFYVADPKISIVFTSSSSAQKDTLYGREIAYHSMYPVTSITGEEITEIEFVTDEGERLMYRDNLPFADVAARKLLEVPFTIETSLVDTVAARLVGHRYYVVTPLWYEADGSNAVSGLRHVPVDVVAVHPGNAVYPLRVVFSPEGDDRDYSMYMTVGAQRSSTRNFHTLFAFDDPRKRYPQITDEAWELITHSRVRNGMSRDECRLALGSPQTIGQRPTDAGMVEYWSYADGIYLLFEDGLLSYYRR